MKLFLLLSTNLVIEVDGGTHKDKDRKKYDALRARALNDLGITVIRFKNEEV